MSNFNYTAEEIKKIRQAMNLILEDIYNLKKQMVDESLVIRLDEGYGSREEFTGWNRVFLRIFSKKDKVYLDDAVLHEVKINLKPSILGSGPSLQFCLLFIEKYDSIRSALISAIENSPDLKGNQMQKVNNVIDRLSKDTFVELDLPKTQNRHQVVVTREGDKTVGVIDFGFSSIKLVTKGDLVLVNKKEINDMELVKAR